MKALGDGANNTELKFAPCLYFVNTDKSLF